MVPVKALVGNEDNGFAVWLYDNQSESVIKTPVEVKHIENKLAVITGNVELGQRVVAAGAAQMRDGMKVLPYKGEK